MEEKEEARKIFLTTQDIMFPTEQMEERLAEFQEVFLLYRSVIKEVGTKLDILSDEFQASRKRNPIEYMKSRIKSLKSVLEKLERKNFPISLQSMKENLNDIAGMRVVCSFIDDIYAIADMLVQQNDITLIEKNDYIKNPKPSGYRSLHLVLEVPVFFSDHTEPVRIEVQIRTIAMDFWASLEHKLHYKSVSEKVPKEITMELQQIAKDITATDVKMQEIRDVLEQLE